MNPVSEVSVPIKRIRLRIYGAVQGIGFRPWVYRLAGEERLKGWVRNSNQGLMIEAEGPERSLELFLKRLKKEKPVHAMIQSLEVSFLDACGYGRFEILSSETAGEKTALVLPDIAVCPACIREIEDPRNRRYGYAFTNCTHCGPRFSIMEALPYDRANTSMKAFGLCPDCAREFEDPEDRRFHAQANACPVCGPHLELWDPAGKILFSDKGLKSGSLSVCLEAAAEEILRGKILALKGLGGFQLMVDAGNSEAVQILRARKGRDEKPFALMMPSPEFVQAVCDMSEAEERLLTSPEKPIVLLRRKYPEMSSVAPEIAPGNPYWGVMLPYTPLHHLLMRRIGGPVVATSGNLSDEPMCTDEKEALARLGKIADLFLVHNRRIVRCVDDSVARVTAGREMILRRARGYAPLPVSLRQTCPEGTAVGAHLKSAIVVSTGRFVFLSQHLGDLETKESFDNFKNAVRDLNALYGLTSKTMVCDKHPDYPSSCFAREKGSPVFEVQHHEAHVGSCMAENECLPPALGVAWDGTGYGPDGTVWGGEFFAVDGSGMRRAAHFRLFSLPGGDRCAREPRRSALGLLFEIWKEAAFDRPDIRGLFSGEELRTLKVMLEKSVQCPRTSSAGRLFDAVAALLGIRGKNRFEGQAPMELEFSIQGYRTDEVYPSRIRIPEWDWEPMIRGILNDREEGIPAGQISAKFHNTLAEAVVGVARLGQEGTKKVVLTGGCFQNQYLIERTIRRLREEGFSPYWHQRVPSNDGGIALGQMAVYAGSPQSRKGVFSCV